MKRILLALALVACAPTTHVVYVQSPTYCQDICAREPDPSACMNLCAHKDDEYPWKESK